MVYLKSFILPSLAQEERGNSAPSLYPYGIFPFKELGAINFGPITILYGSNGSGKSTLLNVIAERLNLPRATLFNTSEIFSQYVNMCKYTKNEDDEGMPLDIPLKSKIITSEDVFDYILTVRRENSNIDKSRSLQREKYYEAKYSKIQFNSMKDLDRLKTQNAARGQTCRAFVRDRTDESIDQFSNGETALKYFDLEFESNRLYLLDEPENSLSPQFQTRLSELITKCAYYCDCQFIIATHSPFILSLPDAWIYNLDSTPVSRKNWYELDNIKMYYEFFKKHEKLFDTSGDDI